MGATPDLRSREPVVNTPQREVVMSEQAQAIFDEAMKLPIGERESLVSRLMRANDEEPLTDAELAAHDEAWAPEIRRRLAEVESGAVETIPWEEVDAQIRKLIGE
ncbi:MAG: addiction module protein [Myxococcales bacterium]|nr:addiction module protein [Myxococcales bacterium]